MSNPNNYVAYGPDANCTVSLCGVEASIYQYRPSLGGNAAFIALFGIVLIINLALGIKWRSWWFMGSMIAGCITEMIGYGGRIMLNQDPFSFSGFLMQICCITFAPVFYCAAIYWTLAKIVNHLGLGYSRFNPSLFYFGFLSCDLVSLVLQAAGGAMSSSSQGSSNNGVYIALAGLSFQVFTLLIFIGLALDYVIRWRLATKTTVALSGRFKLFAACLSLAIILILARCIYRIDELSDGYGGSLIHNEGLFIGLEGVLIIVAAFLLTIAHPGPVFDQPLSDESGILSKNRSLGSEEMDQETKTHSVV